MRTILTLSTVVHCFFFSKKKKRWEKSTFSYFKDLHVTTCVSESRDLYMCSRTGVEPHKIGILCFWGRCIAALENTISVFVFVSQCHVADGIESHGRVTSRHTTQRRHVIHTDAPHFVLLVAATVPRGSNRPTFLFFHATFVTRSRKEFGVSTTIHLCTVTLVLCDANLDAGRSVFLEAPRCRS